MKITHLVPFFSETFRGGIQRYVENVSNLQDAQIYTTTAFCDLVITSAIPSSSLYVGITTSILGKMLGKSKI